MEMVGVVKSFFVRGDSVNGKFEIEIPVHEADLSHGRWRFCLSSAVLTRKWVHTKDQIITVAISTNRTITQIYNTKTKRHDDILGPCRIVLTIAKPCGADCPFKLDFVGHWNEMESISNSFYLLVQDGTHDAGINGQLHAIILLERLY